jgi:7-cyano-7-deazaguanine reductase
MPEPNDFLSAPTKQAEHLQSLGGTTVRYTTPDFEILETFPNATPERNYLIRFETDEFSSRCPKTGGPDYAHFKLEYIAGEKCVESKSLKLYLEGHREFRAFMESITNRMMGHFVQLLQPRGLKVTMLFAARGGISTEVIADYLSSDLSDSVKREVSQKLDIPF